MYTRDVMMNNSHESGLPESPRTPPVRATPLSFSITIVAIRSCPIRSLEVAHYLDFNEYGCCSCPEVLAAAKKRRPSRTRSIIRAVLDYFDLREEELTRPHWAVWPRSVLAYLLREQTDKSLTAIAPMVGVSDHSSVIHLFEKTRLRIENDEVFAREIRYIEELSFHLETSMEGPDEGSQSGDGSRPRPVALVPPGGSEPVIPTIRAITSR
jgi:hypothetical protein